MVISLFRPNEFALVFAAFRFKESIKSYLRGYSCPKRRRGVKSPTRHMFVNKTSRSSEDKSSDESGYVANNVNKNGNR